MIANNRVGFCPVKLYGAKKYEYDFDRYISDEIDASNKADTLVSKLVAAWEKKNAKVARAGGVSLMALSLAACVVVIVIYHQQLINYYNYNN